MQGTSEDSQNEQFSQTTSSILSSQNEAEVDFSEVELGPRIGIGCFGEVFKARWRHTTVAVKRLFDQSLTEQSIKVPLASTLPFSHHGTSMQLLNALSISGTDA